MIGDIMRRLRNALAFGTTTGPIARRGGVVEVQVRLTPLETMTLLVVEQRGVASNLPIGTPVLAMFQSGDRSNGVVAGSVAPNKRPQLEGPEDVSLYGYGYEIRLGRDGVHVMGAPDVFIDGNLHVGGDLRVAGAVVGGPDGAAVTLATHRHPPDRTPPEANT